MADSESKPVGYGFEVQKRADGEEREPETVCELWTNIYRKGCGYRDWETDRKSTRLNSSHSAKSRMPSSA